jgi:hypothetical protein
MCSGRGDASPLTGWPPRIRPIRVSMTGFVALRRPEAAASVLPGRALREDGTARPPGSGAAGAGLAEPFDDDDRPEALPNVKLVPGLAGEGDL